MTKTVNQPYALPSRRPSANTFSESKCSNTLGTKSTFEPLKYAQPFCDFMQENPTVFHAVATIAAQLETAGFTKLSEREAWRIEKSGKYYVERNGSSIIAFAVGKDYNGLGKEGKGPGGVAMIAGHVDALTVRLKPIPKLPAREGFVQVAVAPYAGGLNSTWWDRDLGIAGKVLVKEGGGKRIQTKLVALRDPIARIPTLAPHFGAVANGPFNLETRMIPIIGLEDAENGIDEQSNGDARAFTSFQPKRLVRAIANGLSITDYEQIKGWELELFDCQPATLGGLDKEFIYGGRIDDKLCSWAAIQALLESDPDSSSGSIKCVGLFDDEEIGSLLKQGARSNFMPSTIERIVDSLNSSSSANLVAQTYASSFLVSADVTHAVNPNFLDAYMPHHAPRLNVGVSISADPNGHTTTDGTSTAFLQRVAEKCGSTLQVFQIRNDVRSGGTVGPMLSSAMGVRAIDAGIPQLSMHSIRATTGSLDPGLGVKLFRGFFDYFEEVDEEFRDA